ncbi:hypothetical protein BH11PSE8_BH11PSE8_08670 [soil metagenome]
MARMTRVQRSFVHSPSQPAADRAVAGAWQTLRWVGRVACIAVMAGLAAVAHAAPAVELSVHTGKALSSMNRLGVAADARGRALSITRFDLLLSGMSLQRQDGSWTGDGQWHGFFRAEQPHRRQPLPMLPPGRYQGVRFNVGVGPVANHADPNRLGPDDPLHPLVNGMHWGWQGGYIFVALEGHWQFDKAPKGTSGGYSYHLAGDRNVVPVELHMPIDLRPDSLLRLHLDARRLLAGIDIRRDGDSTHSRNEDASVRALKAALPGAFKAEVLSTAAPPDRADAAQNPGRARAARGAAYPISVGTQLPNFRLPPDNLPTLAGVELGRLLFDDKRLSKDRSMSCASCHRSADAFADRGKAFSTGAGGRVGKRNAMPLFNLAWVDEFFWDGRVKGLRNQVVHPIVDPDEMAGSMPKVLQALNADAALRQRFESALGGPATEARLGLALEQYVLTLISQDSRFDRVMRGEGRFTPSEQRGFDLFLTEHDPARGLFGADCFHCHGGGLFTNQRFMNNGLAERNGDRGREAVTRDPAQRGMFRTPSLRNVALTPPYMHDGRFGTLDEVIAHYDHGVQRSPTLDPNLAKHPPQGLRLSRQDQAALVDFLRTLSDAGFAGARAGAVPAR